jgi:uncharacterized membrane protein YeiH
LSGVNVFHDTGLRMALDYAGVAVFAATGALAAARRGYDIVTFAFFAAITGIGGGTLRDLLIGAPVFWVGDPGYVGVCIAMAGVVWAIGGRLERFRPLLWLDALGLAAYCVVGASKAADWGAPPLVAAVMGVLSATFGGVIRDVLAGEPSVLLRRELYVTPAVGGAFTYVVVRQIGFNAAPESLAAILGGVMAFGLRAGALRWGWTLPGFERHDEIKPPLTTTAVPVAGTTTSPAPTVAVRPPTEASAFPPPLETLAALAAPPAIKPSRTNAADKRAALAEVLAEPVVSKSPDPVPSLDARPVKPRVRPAKPASLPVSPTEPAKPRRPRATKANPDKP